MINEVSKFNRTLKWGKHVGLEEKINKNYTG